ncbi:hypothetical protein GLOTRDRAFT_114117 [Gloeophyllum trabeum ATCC 11539]|uniref:Uncharacterized protein n=1 Tax=Gloeophyllum trabeum (strain ATCC 11539 / FP-39264 / Madison 617) TaxID=670483 RepID=S7QI17_GLOTA|nr:uncharacterized protein GLOTRDRAFT_114117 [Gloeophyllum trabeum ATCC 11539]EPQ59411.1 hypothetical protein GLOTRDRAFT_114117 [Gloeophyllum trabeum ATCC 11539]
MCQQRHSRSGYQILGRLTPHLTPLLEGLNPSHECPVQAALPRKRGLIATKNVKWVQVNL